MPMCTAVSSRITLISDQITTRASHTLLGSSSVAFQTSIFTFKVAWLEMKIMQNDEIFQSSILRWFFFTIMYLYWKKLYNDNGTDFLYPFILTIKLLQKEVNFWGSNMVCLKTIINIIACKYQKEICI